MAHAQRAPYLFGLCHAYLLTQSTDQKKDLEIFPSLLNGSVNNEGEGKTY